jgi:hypothetical protein
MRKQTCETCTHYQKVVVETYYDEDMEQEVEVARHMCDGRQISGTMAKEFRCGNYEARQ